MGMPPNATGWVSIMAILRAGGGHPLAAAYIFPPVASTPCTLPPLLSTHINAPARPLTPWSPARPLRPAAASSPPSATGD